MIVRLKRWVIGLTTAAILTLAAIVAQVQDASAAKPVLAGCSHRIVSIGGDVTEILYALGADKCIVAVDTTSQFPPQALKEKRKVGYMRALSAEGVLSTGGTLVLASEGAGPAEAVRALKASSVRFVSVPNKSTPIGVATKIDTISKAIGKETDGKGIKATLEAEFAALKKRVRNLKEPAKVLFVLATNGSRIIVGGRQTSAHSILSLAGATNAAERITGFKPITMEALLAMAPDAIIVMQRRAGAHSAEALLKLAAIKQTPAGRNDRIFEMSGSYLLGFGPRTPAAASELMHKLYP